MKVENRLSNTRWKGYSVSCSRCSFGCMMCSDLFGGWLLNKNLSFCRKEKMMSSSNLFDIFGMKNLGITGRNRSVGADIHLEIG